MLKSIIEFGNIDVKEIMKSRVDISAIEKSTLFTGCYSNNIKFWIL